MIKNNRLELLSPGGGESSVTAAVNAGCDAVCVGGKAFSARMAADNFDDGGLEEIVGC